MSTTEEIDRYILKKYEVHQRLGKGVRPACTNLLRHSLEATALGALTILRLKLPRGSSASGSLRRAVCEEASMHHK